MQAAQITLKQYGQARLNRRPQGLTAQLSNWLARVFGCRHGEMSRPFTHDGESYRACLECGARRQFDSTRWEMTGAYYYDRPKNRQASLPEIAPPVLTSRTRAGLRQSARVNAYN
jgi:hypothetical protein